MRICEVMLNKLNYNILYYIKCVVRFSCFRLSEVRLRLVTLILITNKKFILISLRKGRDRSQISVVGLVLDKTFAFFLLNKIALDG